MSDASFAYDQSNELLQNNVSALQGKKSRYRKSVQQQIWFYQFRSFESDL